MSSERRPSFAQLEPTRSKSPTFGRIRVELGRSGAQADTSRPNSGQACPGLGHVRPTSVDLARNRRQIWSEFGQFRETLARNRPNSARDRPTRATYLRKLRHLGRRSACVDACDRHSPNVDRTLLRMSGTPMAQRGQSSAPQSGHVLSTCARPRLPASHADDGGDGVVVAAALAQRVCLVRRAARVDGVDPMRLHLAHVMPRV